MTRSEMIAYIKANPYVKITHFLFDKNEWLESHSNGKVYDEKGYLFEDWDELYFRWNGIRMRVGGQWEDGWRIKDETTQCKYHLEIPTVGLCCEAYYLSKGYKGCQERSWFHFPFCSEENCPLKHPELLKGATLESEANANGRH